MKVNIHPSMPEDPKRRGGEVLIVQPDEDLLDPDGSTYSVGSGVDVLLPSPDGAMWESVGEIIEVDTDDDPMLWMVRVDWGQATLVA